MGGVFSPVELQPLLDRKLNLGGEERRRRDGQSRHRAHRWQAPPGGFWEGRDRARSSLAGSRESLGPVAG